MDRIRLATPPWSAKVFCTLCLLGIGAGALAAAAVFLTEDTIHGPVRVAVGLAADGTVRDAAVTELTEETYGWVKPLLDRGVARPWVGRGPAGPFAVAGASAGSMTEFYGRVVAGLVQRAAILFAAAPPPRPRGVGTPTCGPSPVPRETCRTGQNVSRCGGADGRAIVVRQCACIATMGRDPGILHGVHVLVVDDNDDAREIIEAHLAHDGAMVISAPSGAEALEILQAVRVHVIVSDISMPGMTGHEFIRHVRALPNEAARPTPALALTAFVHEQARALASGFQAYLAKPIDPALVAREVARLAQVDEPPGLH